MQGYREAAPAPANSTIDYFPYGPRGRYTYVALFFVFALVFFWMTWSLTLTEVRVRCSRAEGACSVLTTHPLSGTSATWIPLSIITDAQPRLSPGKNPSYYVVLRTTGGEENLGGHSTFADAQQIASVLNLFFTIADAPDVDITTNPTRPPLGALFILFGFGSAAIACVFLQTARVEVLWNEHIFRLIHRRWPLPPRTRDFALGAVRGAYVTTARARNGAVYGASIRVGDEDEITLPGDRSAGGDTKRRVVSEIQELLRIRDAGGPSAT